MITIVLCTGIILAHCLGHVFGVNFTSSTSTNTYRPSIPGEHPSRTDSPLPAERFNVYGVLRLVCSSFHLSVHTNTLTLLIKYFFSWWEIMIPGIWMRSAAPRPKIIAHLREQRAIWQLLANRRHPSPCWRLTWSASTTSARWKRSCCTSCSAPGVPLPLLPFPLFKKKRTEGRTTKYCPSAILTPHIFLLATASVQEKFTHCGLPQARTRDTILDHSARGQPAFTRRTCCTNIYHG